MARARRPKRTERELEQMGSGLLMGNDIIRKLVRVIRAKGGTWTQIHALTKPEGEATIERMAEAFLDAAHAVAQRFPTWMTVTLGTHRTIAELCQAITTGGCRIGDPASPILGKIMLASQETTVEIVQATGAQLGQIEKEALEQICARAKARGFQCCPAEIGVQLRRQYMDQPDGDVLFILMEPIMNSFSRPFVLVVGRDMGRGNEDGQQWLGAASDRVWPPGIVWVFVRSQSA